MASSPSTTPPASVHARFDPQLFRVLLLRRLWQLLPPVSRIFRCGRPLDSSGHHRAASVQSAVARVCREAGGRVPCNVCVPVAGDGRRLEVVTDGLPLFHGAQLALDATMVSALRCDGTARSSTPSGTRPLFLIVGNRGQHVLITVHTQTRVVMHRTRPCTAPVSLVAMVCTHASRCSGFRDSREPVTIGCTPVALSRTFVCLAALLGRSSSVSVHSASFRCWTKSVLQFLQLDFDEIGF